jgi:hypothetical protein
LRRVERDAALKSCVALTVVTVTPFWVTVTVTVPLRSTESAVNFIIDSVPPAIGTSTLPT